MKKVIIFLVMAVGINAMAHLGGPCSVEEKKCVIRGFNIDGNVLNESEASTIREIVNDLNKYGKSGTIDIIGHTDSKGTDAYNMALGMRRAVAVRDKLLEFGLDPARIVGVESRGESQPIAPNDTDEGRFQNRRIQFEATRD